MTKITPVDPSHYRDNNHQIIEIIRWMHFDIGNTIKYIYRYNRKENPVQDLKKALWYIRDYYHNNGFLNFDTFRGVETVEKIKENNFIHTIEDSFIKNMTQKLIQFYCYNLSGDKKEWEELFNEIEQELVQKIEELSQ